MHKRDITYEDLDGNKVTETFYFNLTKTEIVNMEVEHEEGLDEWFKRIVRMEDRKALVGEFKKIILMSYGERSEDNKRFIKNDELRERFAQTMAFDQLFFELATDENKASEFLIALLPAEVQAEARRLESLQPPNIRPAEDIRAEKTVELPQPPARTATTPPPPTAQTTSSGDDTETRVEGW